MSYLSAIIGVIGTLLGGALSYAAFFRNSKKDSHDDGVQAGTVLTELGYIRSGVDDLKAEIREQREKNTEFISRLTAVEASARQAHERIDRIEGSDRYKRYERDDA